jgi:hypothetical protein
MRMSAAAGLGLLMMAAGAPLYAQGPPLGPAASAVPAEDIRDIRGPKSLLAQAPAAPLGVGVLILLAVGAYGAWRWQRHRGRARNLLPFEFALRELDRARGMMQPAAAREFGGRVSDIVRHYIERQFNVTVTQRTTQEFLQDLMSASSLPLAHQRPLLTEFLQQSDLIKFAGGSVSLQALESLLQSARRLVRETAQAETYRDSIPAA